MFVKCQGIHGVNFVAIVFAVAFESEVLAVMKVNINAHIEREKGLYIILRTRYLFLRRDEWRLFLQWNLKRIQFCRGNKRLNDFDTSKAIGKSIYSGYKRIVAINNNEAYSIELIRLCQIDHADVSFSGANYRQRI